MNQRLRAAFITASLLASAVVLTLAFRLVFTYITPEMAPWILMAVSMAFLVYVMYMLILQQIRDRDELKRMVDRK